MAALITFIVCAVFILYVFAGYPLLLGWMAKRRSRPVARAPYFPPVSILIAVYNGERYLEAKLRSILALDYPKENMEILVASDGSTDTTADIARSYAGRGVRLLQLPRGGKCAALNAAIAEAKHEMLVLTDVRQALAPDSLARLMENMADPQVGAASGELTILRGASQEEAAVGLYWRYEVWIRLRLSAIDSIFGATGAYYVLRRHLAVPLPADTLLDDMHLPLTAFFRGYRLIVDSRARMFDYPTGLGQEFWRKVRTLAGNYQILRAYPQLLSPANRMVWHFLSYKFGRLLLPYALLLAGIASFFLPLPEKWIILAAQALFYLIALLDPVLPEMFPLKRFSSAARTFVTMMAATVCALAVFFVSSRRLWKI